MSIKPEYDEEIARLVSYLTFDGHLAEDLKGFYLSSKSKELLLDFENIVYKQFGIKGRLDTNLGYGVCNKYWVFSRPICRFLESIGVPKGNKTRKRFSVPSWIKENNRLSENYLMTSFDCEGSIWKDSAIRIRFGIFKSLPLSDNLQSFISELKGMMLELGVETTDYWLTKIKENPCGISTIGAYFSVRQKSIKSFAQNIGFSDRFKNQRLSKLLGA